MIPRHTVILKYLTRKIRRACLTENNVLQQREVTQLRASRSSGRRNQACRKNTIAMKSLSLVNVENTMNNVGQRA